MRPMCGSSSATSTCRVLVTGSGGVSCGTVRCRPSDESGDVRAVAAQFVQQLTEVRRGLHEDEQHGVGGKARNHGESMLVFHDRSLQSAARGGGAELVGK